MYHSGQQMARADGLRALIVDDHPLYGDALQLALGRRFGNSVIKRAETLAETLETLESGFMPDLIIFDLKLPDVQGISGFHKLRDHSDAARVLIVSSLASTNLVQSLLAAGADGFVPKDAPTDTLHIAIEHIMDGRGYVPKQFAHAKNTSAGIERFKSNPELSSLTGQQMRILELICAGKPNKQIAYELSLAEATVKAHITALLRRLGVYNRTQAVVVAESALMRHGTGAPEAQAFLRH